MNRLERESPCKINLLLNVLGKRADGFHELETIMHPVRLSDTLAFERIATTTIELTCNHPALPTNETNLVHRAAASFLMTARISTGIRIHLEKRVPLAAGLGGGSSNAAATLLGLNELLGEPLDSKQLYGIAAGVGSDVPFFLQSLPALATGRGEAIEPLKSLPALQGVWVLLIHPGFGVATAWAYQALAQFPEAQNGRAGRARQLVEQLQRSTLTEASSYLYNALEAPVLFKYPILQLYQDFLRANGALATLMSGSGSTTFALVPGLVEGDELRERFKARFGKECWAAVAALPGG
jgi:4-diphosphocytidyl-2-C-methyl-D-erythritol kinase